MNRVTILFNEYGTCKDNTRIANKEIGPLLSTAVPDLEVIRVNGPDVSFDRAVIHLGRGAADAFIEATKHSFVALLVTTEVGVPVSRPHIVLKDPKRVILAVRRMAALEDPATWRAFLVASVDDCVAAARGRPLDVSEPARPLFRLLTIRSEVVPALMVLCTVYEELVSRKPTPDAAWSAMAARAESPEWWRRVLDSARVVDRNGKEGSWGVDGNAPSARSTSLLMDQIIMEANRRDAEAESDVERLVAVISDGRFVVTPGVVSAARAGLEKIMR